jgi:ABC-type antimicrobial peptide transport system permease subunit
MDIELVDGRMFTDGSKMDMERSVIVNEKFLEEHSVSDPLNHSLYVNDSVTLYVVGVVENSYTNALWGPLEPSLFRLSKEDDYRRVFIKADVQDLTLAHEHLGEVYTSLFPNRVYNGVFMNDDLAESDMINNNIVKMNVFLGLVALLLSVTGLYAMISLNLLRRVKEIGVRKVLGASVGSIIIKLNRPFIIIVLVALIIGTVGAYYMNDALLAMIWYHYAAPGAMPILLSCLLLFTIAIFTVTARVYKAATVNPVRSLRSE